MTFVWDRRDAYGREVVGGQTLSVKIDYNYPTTYKEPGPFPAGFNSVGLVSLNANPTRQQINLSQSFTTTIGEGLTDARTIGLGGWTLSAHNVYDPNARVAHLGSGSRRRAGSLARTLTTVPVPGQTVLFDVEVAPDGSQLVALPHGDQIVRVATDGTVSVVAGNGTEGFSGDGGPATQAMLGDPTGIALAPDGSLYIAEQANFRVRKVSPAGIISTGRRDRDSRLRRRRRTGDAGAIGVCRANRRGRRFDALHPRRPASPPRQYRRHHQHDRRNRSRSASPATAARRRRRRSTPPHWLRRRTAASSSPTSATTACATWGRMGSSTPSPNTSRRSADRCRSARCATAAC